MFRSMTAFGRARETVNGKDITAEIKSVNNRYFDCSVKITKLYSFLEDKIKQYLQTKGISRGKIKEVAMDEEEGYFKATIEEVVYDFENAEEDVEVEAFVRNVFDAFEEYINIGNRVSPEILISLADTDNVDRFIDTIAANIYLKAEQKQSILEEFDVKKRLELIYTILLEEIEILKIEKKITLRVKKQMNKVQIPFLFDFFYNLILTLTPKIYWNGLILINDIIHGILRNLLNIEATYRAYS